VVHDPKIGSRGASLKHLGTATKDAAEKGTEHEGPRFSVVSVAYPSRRLKRLFDSELAPERC
jgi:hypothetical protein